MAQRMYEFLVLLDPSKISSDVEAAVHGLHSTFEKHGSEMLASRPWNEQQKLAYPIQHQKKGFYYLIYARIDSSKITDIEHDLKLNENVLRYMPVRIDPKWEEDMLAVAKDEHALALQIGSNPDAMDATESFEAGRRSGAIAPPSPEAIKD